jgi:hypothetical protein
MTDDALDIGVDRAVTPRFGTEPGTQDLQPTQRVLPQRVAHLDSASRPPERMFTNRLAWRAAALLVHSFVALIRPGRF